MTTTAKTIASDRTEIQMGSAVPTFLVADVGGAARYAWHTGDRPETGANPSSGTCRASA